jgi:two-component system sensor histidine kinase AtoS
MLKRVPIFWKLSAAFIVTSMLVLLALSFVNDLISSHNLQIALAVAIAVALSCLFAWLIVSIFIMRPVRQLTHGMSKLAEREFDIRLDEDEKDEFGSLASSFNDMAAMLSSSLTELKKNQDYLRSILESSADIIITVNPNGKIQTMNSGAENVLGYSRLEVIAQPIEMFFADPHERELAIAQLEHADNVVNYETKFVTKSGEIRDVLLTLSRLRNADRAVIGTIGISKDVTREKRLQAKLIQSQRLAAIGEVFTGIQHSMKNMLNACKGGAYMVRTGLGTENRTMLEEGWEMVQEGINRMTEMSTDMLKYVKEYVPRSARVDLSSTVEDIFRVIQQTAGDKGVQMQLEVAPGLPDILCDGKMIHSAVMDIVSNAVDACLGKDYIDGEVPKVVISVSAIPDGQELIIEVKDNGCGMSEEVKASIFTPFFSTKGRAGTGLGLSLTSRVITVHGGKIDVESEPDNGAVFRIALPVDGPAKNKEHIDGKDGSGS